MINQPELPQIAGGKCKSIVWHTVLIAEGAMFLYPVKPSASQKYLYCKTYNWKKIACHEIVKTACNKTYAKLPETVCNENDVKITVNRTQWKFMYSKNYEKSCRKP